MESFWKFFARHDRWTQVLWSAGYMLGLAVGLSSSLVVASVVTFLLVLTYVWVRSMTIDRELARKSKELLD